MPRASSASLTQRLWLRLAVMLTLSLFGPISSQAQLTDDDIASIRKRIASEGYSFTVGRSEATDLPLDMLCGLVEPPDWRKTGRFVEVVEKGPLPHAFDWRKVAIGGLPPVRNQGGCGSCWAFSTVGALECAIKIQDAVEVDLSEQWLVSCNRHGWGCDGGWYAHDYLCFTDDQCGKSGAVLEQDYPYTHNDSPCQCYKPHSYKIRDWAYVGPADEVPSVSVLKQAILNHGPISVAVAVDNNFQAYQSGVFKLSTASQINHAVVLVGWDDTLGGSGAWIMRNSWGAGWGEDGYMYIAYGCDNIGYAASFIEYAGGVTVSSDTRSGWAPFEVNFVGSSGLTLTDWNWDFGDGTTAAGVATAHSYANPGIYDVVLTAVDSLGQLRRGEKKQYIMSLADTARCSSFGAVANSEVAVPISVRNNIPVRSIRIPVEYNGPVALTLDSFSTVGCRTDYFERVSAVQQDPLNRRLTLQLTSSDFQTSPHLEPGEGPVAMLYFSVPPQSNYGAVTPISLSGYLTYAPLLSWPDLSWTPATSGGSVTLAVYRGNCDGFGAVTVSDLTYLVNYLFRGGPAPAPLLAGDCDCNQTIGVSDLTYLVGFLFRAGQAPVLCF